MKKQKKRFDNLSKNFLLSDNFFNDHEPPPTSTFFFKESLNKIIKR